jgi:hypothetical protein
VHITRQNKNERKGLAEDTTAFISQQTVILERVDSVFFEVNVEFEVSTKSQQKSSRVK